MKTLFKTQSNLYRFAAIIGGTLLLIIVIIGVIMADKQASQYIESKAEWKSAIAMYAKESNTVRLSDKFVVDRWETSEELQAQKDACTTNDKRLDWIQKNHEGPVLGFNLVGFISGNYRTASSDNAKVDNQKALFTKLTAHLNDFKRVCQYQTMKVENHIKTKEAAKAADQYLVFEGSASNSEAPCTSLSGCLPRDKSIWVKIADTYSVFVDEANKNADIYKNHCFSDAYREVCSTQVEYYTEKASEHKLYNDELRKGSAERFGFLARLNDKYIPKLEAVYIKANSEFKTKFKSTESLILQDMLKTTETNIDQSLKAISNI